MSYAEMLGLKNIEPAIMQTCLAIENNAVQNVPVKHGMLRNSISIATELREQGFNSQALEKAPESAKITAPEMGDGTTAYVGSGLVYAAAVEFGLPDRKNYPCQPYLRPAAMLVRAKMLGEFSKELGKNIKDWANSQRYRFRSRGGIVD